MKNMKKWNLFTLILFVSLLIHALFDWIDRVRLLRVAQCEKEIHRLKNLLEEAQTHADFVINAHLGQEEEVGSKEYTSEFALKNKTNAYWLSIAIPTVPRENNADYLVIALASWAVELLSVNSAKPPQAWMHLHIMNVHGQGHTRFDQVESLYKDLPYSSCMHFRTMLLDHDKSSDSRHDMGSRNRPGWKVRRQTRHVVAVMLSVLDQSKYFLFVEDDMQLCPHALLVVNYIISRATLIHNDFMAIRTSFGLNGIIIHSKDGNNLANYLLKHHEARPPDHLIVAWYAGEEPATEKYKGKRPHLGYRYNIMRHLGARSTLRPQVANIEKMPQCYEELVVPIVFPIEAFNPRLCPADDFTPCVKGGATYPPLLFGKHLREPLPSKRTIVASRKEQQHGRRIGSRGRN